MCSLSDLSVEKRETRKEREKDYFLLNNTKIVRSSLLPPSLCFSTIDKCCSPHTPVIDRQDGRLVVEDSLNQSRKRWSGSGLKYKLAHTAGTVNYKLQISIVIAMAILANYTQIIKS